MPSKDLRSRNPTIIYFYALISLKTGFLGLFFLQTGSSSLAEVNRIAEVRRP